ncbi:MAG: hypothetical protein HC880_03365 [Bacteroidia bacterium]|nr:hypothetical protein [Bacteroidia bacterium]
MHSFAETAANGSAPQAGLVQTTTGQLISVTPQGGANLVGTLYTIEPDGTGFNILSSFGVTEGRAPVGGLVEDATGTLYGVTRQGGPDNKGAIFAISKTGANFRILHYFDGSDGEQPAGGLLLGSDGLLYGLTRLGGTSHQGTIFIINRNGSGFNVLWHLNDPDEGVYPRGSLIEGSDGRLYGVTERGGTPDQGIIFRIDRSGIAFTVLHAFSDGINEGQEPAGSLVEGSNDLLYGMTRAGGILGQGTLFSFDPVTLDLVVLHNFGGGNTDGAAPLGSLIEASNDSLYGLSAQGGPAGRGTVFRIAKNGGGFAVLHTFNNINGSTPQGGLVEDTNGRLYGTTQAGGTFLRGTVFGIDLDGSDFSVLRSFQLITSGDGALPELGKLLLTTLSTPVPIRLVDFQARRQNDEDVLLEWQTALEENNLGFAIELSEDAREFRQVGFVDGAGNSNQLRRYSFVVQQRAAAYYRLRQIDFDDSFSFSPIRFVAGKAGRLTIYPNPASGPVRIAREELSVSATPVFHMQVTDVQGKYNYRPRLRQMYSIPCSIRPWINGRMAFT